MKGGVYLPVKKSEEKREPKVVKTQTNKKICQIICKINHIYCIVHHFTNNKPFALISNNLPDIYLLLIHIQ